jgi:hypothetical protein
MSQIPVAIGLMLCEQVIIEEKTRNLTPVNCFNLRRVRDFPSEDVAFTVLALVTDGPGEHQVDIVIHRLDTLDVIYRRSATVRFSNPLQDTRCMIRVPDCSFPDPGHYQVMLLFSKEMVAQRKLTVLPQR